MLCVSQLVPFNNVLWGCVAYVICVSHAASVYTLILPWGVQDINICLCVCVCVLSMQSTYGRMFRGHSASSLHQGKWKVRGKCMCIGNEKSRYSIPDMLACILWYFAFFVVFECIFLHVFAICNIWVTDAVKIHQNLFFCGQEVPFQWHSHRYWLSEINFDKLLRFEDCNIRFCASVNQYKLCHLAFWRLCFWSCYLFCSLISRHTKMYVELI